MLALKDLDYGNTCGGKTQVKNWINGADEIRTRDLLRDREAL